MASQRPNPHQAKFQWQNSPHGWTHPQPQQRTHPDPFHHQWAREQQQREHAFRQQQQHIHAEHQKAMLHLLQDFVTVIRQNAVQAGVQAFNDVLHDRDAVTLLRAQLEGCRAQDDSSKEENQAVRPALDSICNKLELLIGSLGNIEVLMGKFDKLGTLIESLDRFGVAIEQHSQHLADAIECTTTLPHPSRGVPPPQRRVKKGKQSGSRPGTRSSMRIAERTRQ